MEANEKKEEDVEGAVVNFSKEYYVLELEARTLSHITKVEYMNDNTKMYFDVIQTYNGKSTFMRFPKSLFMGLYKII